VKQQEDVLWGSGWHGEPNSAADEPLGCYLCRVQTEGRIDRPDGVERRSTVLKLRRTNAHAEPALERVELLHEMRLAFLARK
jgi:hypothetical protein